MNIQCVQCGEIFFFSSGEQKFYQKKSLNQPTRCKPCKSNSSNRKSNSSNPFNPSKGYWFDVKARKIREAGTNPGNLPTYRNFQGREVTKQNFFKINGDQLPVETDINPEPFQDRVYPCRLCGQDYTYTAGEQYFLCSKGFLNHRTCCKDCKAENRREMNWKYKVWW